MRSSIANTVRQFALNLRKRHPRRQSVKRKRVSTATNEDFVQPCVWPGMIIRSPYP